MSNSTAEPANVVQNPVLVKSEKPLDAAFVEKVDIEHVFVQNDPRKWSTARKNLVLVIISAATMIAGLSANIQNPSIQQIEDQLHASSSDISWSISLFILIQGNTPIIWSAISEIKGRKIVYMVSLFLYTLGCIIVALSKSIGLMIGMRCLQAVGSSAVMTIGAATLTDVFEPSERGAKMGIYYAAPLLGPSLGPILGGALTQGFSWRASFWFLAIFGGLNFISFSTLFEDTFRRERSITYQAILAQRIKERDIQRAKEASQITPVVDGGEQLAKEKPIFPGPVVEDVESQVHCVSMMMLNTPALDNIKVSLVDVNPFRPVSVILRRMNYLTILVPSGFFFAFSFSTTYTTSRTLGTAYNYNPLQIGLVLLAFGAGNFLGSVLGGRWSDRVLNQLKENNGGKSYAEMRLESTVLALWILPPSIVGYAWTLQKHVHISAICVMLFLTGFFSIWIYASTLTYIVDANIGRSSTAVATNTGVRGLMAFVAAEIAVPLQDAIGDGWMYTLWAGIMIIAELMIFLVMKKGGGWREAAIAREERNTNAKQ